MQLARGLDWREAAEGQIVIQIVPGEELRSNAAGSLIWKLVAEGLDEEAIAGRVAEEFDVATAAARRDVGLFLAELEDQLLFERE